MKIDVTENKENPLMKRNDVRILVYHEGKATPSRMEILEYLSKSLKAGKENIVINKIFGLKGLDRSEARVTVYKDKKDIPKALAEKMTRRNKPPKTSEKDTQTPAVEEKPKEESKKEDKPAEEKPESEEPKEEKKDEQPSEEEKK